MNINEADIAVKKYLDSIGVKFEVSHMAEMIGAGIEWEHDLFNVIMSRKDKTPQVTQYKTGTGHRVIAKEGSHYPKKSDMEKLKELKELHDGARVSVEAKKPILLQGFKGKRYRDRFTAQFVVLPTQASILHCLLLDMDADSMSFPEWCDCFGYDSDSIKARSTYDACNAESVKIRAIFSASEIEHLRTLLEDY